MYSWVMTTNIREAIQFATKKDATIAAKVIGWRVSDALPIEIMGFRLYSIGDEHGRFLTKDEFNRLATERASALTPATH